MVDDLERARLADWFWPAAVLALCSGLVGTAWFALGIAPTLSNLAIGAVMYRCLMQPDAALPRLLTRPALVRLGVISYSLYLWQQLFLDRHSSRWYCAFPLNVALAVACAVASYQLVEKPFLRLSARLRAARDSVRIGQPQVADAQLAAVVDDRGP